VQSQKKRLLIDCTYVYSSELNTGIQRVVRNIAKNAKNISGTYNLNVELVILNNGKIKKIDSIPINKVKVLNKNFIFFKNVYNIVRKIVLKILPFQFLKNFFYNTKEEFGLRYLVEEMLFKTLSGRLPFFMDKKFKLENVFLNENDILLLLDSTWHNDIYGSLELAKKNKVKIITVIYDIIPISYPEFCDDSLGEVFKKWLINIIKYSDGFLAISNSVKNDVKKYLLDNLNYRNDNFDYFMLGSDFSKKDINIESVRFEIENIFKTKKNTYVIVSTIEARKNHIQVLRVFNKLWEEGFDSNLLIIGKIGWKVESLIKEIKNHNLLNKKLFMFNDIDDNELQYIYNNANASIFPSIIEGFGLPIIEGLNNNLKVIASDTSIHREVGKDFIEYFDLNDDKSLKELILSHENEKKKLIAESIKILNWKECTDDIINKILAMDKKIDSNEDI